MVDLSQNQSIQGNLYSIELQLNSALESGSVGDTYEIEKIGFFDTADKAYAAYGGASITESNDTTETQPSTTEPTTSTGCGSALNFLPIGLLLILVCVWAFAGQKKFRYRA